jgi:hypothetical protein
MNHETSVAPNRAARRSAARRSRKIAALSSGAVLATGMATGALAAFPHGAGAATTITVTNTNDAGAGSLRQALLDANPGDTVDLSGVTGTITLSTGELKIHDAVSIVGPGPSALTVDANHASRVFYLHTDLSGATLTISGLTITGGSAEDGAGVYFDCNHGSGSIVVDNSVVTGNTADELGGGLYFDQCDAGGSMTVSNSVVSNNTSTDDGAGGIWFDEGQNLTIQNTTISGNQAQNWDGGGVVFDDGASFSIVDSTVSGNSSTDQGGGLAIHRPTSSALIANSTITGNTATNGGGVYLEKGALSILQSTISGNTASDTGDGLYIGYSREAAASHSDRQEQASASAVTNANVQVVGTIIAANADGTDDIASADLPNVLTLRSSVIGAVNGITPGDGGGNQMGVTDPGLDPLANNGGATETMALHTGSVAIDAGPDPVPDFVGNEFDQRGSGFPRVVNGTVDVGAFEVQPEAPAPAPAAVVVTPKFTG